MMDRTPTKVLSNGAIRYGVYDEAGNFLRYEYIKPEDEPTQEGTPINKDTLFSDLAAESCGLPTTATPNDAFFELGERTKSALVRDLSIMLNLSLGTNNIDAWADLLSDDSRINTSISSGYSVSNGVAKCEITSISQLDTANNIIFGYNSSYQKVGQTFTATKTGLISSIVAAIGSGGGTPTDAITMKVYAADKVTLLAVSTNTFSGPYFPGTQEFFFAGLNVIQGTTYFFEISRSGSFSTTNYYLVSRSNSAPYFGGAAFVFGSSNTWTTQSTDLYFIINQVGTATIVWKPVSSTEPFIRMAISAEQSLGLGTITYYVSNDGKAWIQVSNLNAVQSVSFSTKSVYLRVQITGNASLDGIAWGGY